MSKDLINKKYYPLIWVALIFASLVANVYPIYLSFVELESVTVSKIVLYILRAIFFEGGLPAAWCFLLAFVSYSMVRRVTGVPKNDFIYTVMAFTAAARLLIGIIDAFCILEPRMSVITSAVLNLVVMTVAYAVMFFLVFDKRYKMNPVERYYSFRIWTSIYLILTGISVVFINAVYLLVFNDEDLLKLVNEALVDVLGYTIVKDSLQTVASAIALSIYAVFVMAAVAVGEMMKKQAKGYQAPETRGDYFDANPNRPYNMRDDVNQTYGDFDDAPYKSKLDENPYRSEGDNVDGKNDDNNKNDNSGGNVFDEFDI